MSLTVIQKKKKELSCRKEEGKNHNWSGTKSERFSVLYNACDSREKHKIACILKEPHHT